MYTVFVLNRMHSSERRGAGSLAEPRGLMKVLTHWVRGTGPQRHHLRANWQPGVQSPLQPLKWVKGVCDQQSEHHREVSCTGDSDNPARPWKIHCFLRNKLYQGHHQAEFIRAPAKTTGNSCMCSYTRVLEKLAHMCLCIYMIHKH